MAETLQKNGVKFDPAGLLWTMGLHTAGLDEVVKNKMPGHVLFKTQLVFFEKGNDKAGLVHIVQRHQADFASMCGVTSENDIQKYIRKYMGMGHYATYGYELGDRFVVVYQIHESLFLRVAIGFNGYIVSAYPSSNRNREDNTEY